MKQAFLIAILTMTMIFSGCKDKDEDPRPPEKSRAVLITQASWKITAATIDPAYGGITDLYAQMDACEKDDTTKLEVGGVLTTDEGPTKCDPADPQTIPGTWVFNSNETILTINGRSYTVLALSETTLKLSEVQDIGGTNYTNTITFTH